MLLVLDVLLSCILFVLLKKQPQKSQGGLLGSKTERKNSYVRKFFELEFKHPHGKLCNFCNQNLARWRVTALLPEEGEAVFCCDDCREIAKWSTQHRVDLPFIPDDGVREVLEDSRSFDCTKELPPDHEK